jgi:hypothetical protein
MDRDQNGDDMSHWAEINENGLVLRVLVGDNEDPNGDEGYQWLLDNLGGTWIKTSYNGNIRKNYAGMGFSYDAELDAFIPPKPYESWVLDEETAQWVSPVAYPEGEELYYWDEEILNWSIREMPSS